MRTSTFKVGDRVNYTLSRESWQDIVITRVKEKSAVGGTLYFAKDKHGAEGAFYPHQIELVEDDWDFDPRRPLVIQAGKFYRTRDGRKVGPMRKYASNQFDWADYNDDLFRTDGTGIGNYDLVAERTTSCAAAEVDNLRDEYGPFVKPSATAGNDNGKPKFKVGDRVRIVSGPTNQRFVGTCFTIDSDEGLYDGEQSWSGRDNISPYRYKESQLELTSTPAIVALIKDGQPRPATEPHVHPSRGHAQGEAGRLSRKYPGKEFGVYELVSTIQQKPAYDHEWQRLAASGEKIAAIKELRGLTGMGLRPAKDAVEYFLDAA